MRFRHNFGTSPELLFKPCQQSASEDGEAGQCFLGAEGRSYAYDPVIRLVRSVGSSNSNSGIVVSSAEIAEGPVTGIEGGKVKMAGGGGAAAETPLAESEVDEKVNIKEFVSNQ